MLSRVEGLRYPHPPPCEILATQDGEADLTEQVTAAYFNVRLIPQDLESSRLASGIYDRVGFRKAQLAYGHFPSASQKPVFRQSL